MKSPDVDPASILRPRPLLGWLCVAVATTMSFAPYPSLVLGQASPGTPAATNKEPKEPVPPEYALEIVDGMYKYRGKKVIATLANVVEGLRDMFRGNDIVLSPDLAQVRIQDLKLRPAGGSIDTLSGPVWPPASLDDSLAALQVASGNRFIWRSGAAPGAPLVDPATGLPVNTPPREPSSLYILLPDPQATPPNRVVEVFNLHGYLSHLSPPKPDDPEQDRSAGAKTQLVEIQQVIQETLEALGRGTERPDVQYHTGTRLLVVIGTPEAIDVARKIVTALPYYYSSAGPVGGAYPQGAPGGGMLQPGAGGETDDAFRKRYGVGPDPGSRPQTPTRPLRNPGGGPQTNAPSPNR